MCSSPLANVKKLSLSEKGELKEMQVVGEDLKEKSNQDTVDLDESVKELMSENNSVFNTDGELKTMAGGPMKIELVDDVPIKPIHINTPRKTPYAYQNTAKAKLDQLLDLGILEKFDSVSE